MMGIEYSVKFTLPEVVKVEALLKQLGCSPGASPCEKYFEFRKECSSTGMPDATVMLTDDGLYYCDHGGFGREFLGRLVASLVSRFGAVTIRDWEE